MLWDWVCFLVLLPPSWQSLGTISLLFPGPHLHHIIYQAGKGVNAAGNIPEDVITPLFPISNINLLGWERMPREEEGGEKQRSIVGAAMVYPPDPPRLTP